MEKQSLPKQRSRVRFPYPAPKISQIHIDLGDFLCLSKKCNAFKCDF